MFIMLAVLAPEALVMFIMLASTTYYLLEMPLCPSLVSHTAFGLEGAAMARDQHACLGGGGWGGVGFHLFYPRGRRGWVGQKLQRRKFTIVTAVSSQTLLVPAP